MRFPRPALLPDLTPQKDCLSSAQRSLKLTMPTEVIDFFAPVREDFLTVEIPAYMAQR